MIAALLIGKHTSGSVPGKNYMEILGRPMVAYPLMAAKFAKKIGRIYVSTDSPVIREIASQYDAELIERPEEMAKSESPTELVYEHGYRHILEREKNLEFLVLMFANTPRVLSSDLDRAIDMLELDDTLDSVISIAQYNMFSPMRARRLRDDGISEPTLDLDSLGLNNTFDRDAMGDIYYCDFGVMVVRPERCLENPTGGDLPFTWLGHKQGSIVVDGGFDIDAPWQIPAIEFWMHEIGFSETQTPYNEVGA